MTAMTPSEIVESFARGEPWRFYKTAEWRELRTRVLERAHGECEMCRERGRYSPAETVHHVCHVDEHPELALCETYDDADGTHRNLVALCHSCHDEVHGRFKFKPKPPPLTEERW